MVVIDEVVGGRVTVTINVVIAGSMVLQCGRHRCVCVCVCVVPLMQQPCKIAKYCIRPNLAWLSFAVVGYT